MKGMHPKSEAINSSPLKATFCVLLSQSGNGVAPWSFEQHPENDRQKAESLGDAMGCDDVSDSSLLVECLQTKDANELMTTAARVNYNRVQYI